jgi:hypothetical protein
VYLFIAITLSVPDRISAFTGLISDLNRQKHLKNAAEKRYQENERIVFRKHTQQLYMESGGINADATKSNVEHQSDAKSPMRVRRIGGRRKTKSRSHGKSSILTKSLRNVLTSTQDNRRKFVLYIASAALICVMFLSRLLDGSSPSPNFVYYQSSVIERRVVGPDGTVETSRKESFKSNLPDLVRQQRQNTQTVKEMNEVDTRRFEEEFRKNDEQMRRSLDSLLDFERKFLLDDFF